MTDLDADIEDQDEAIRNACLRKDESALKKYAIVGGGLKSDSLRKMAWPILCNVSNSVDELAADKEFFSTLKDKFVFADHPDWPVIVADIHRTVMWFDDIDDHEELKAKLTQVIMGILLDDHELCYFQGFNVVCAVIFRVLGNDEFSAFRLGRAVTAVHFRHLMLDRKGEKMWDFLSYIFPIIGKVNNRLRLFLESADLRENVCISWILTWLGYHIGSVTFEEICRLFDFFLAAGDKFMPVYFSAALILLHADGIMQCEPEMTEVFQYVKQIPESIPFERVIRNSIDLHRKVPLASVEDEARDLIKMRSEQQNLVRRNVKQMQLMRYSLFWRYGYQLYYSQNARAIAASTLALGAAYFYTRNPDALNQFLRIVRKCASSATFNVVGVDVDFLLG